jgi:hypothetical protein
MGGMMKCRPALVEGPSLPAQQAGVKFFGRWHAGGDEFVPAEIAGFGRVRFFAHNLFWMVFLRASQNFGKMQRDFSRRLCASPLNPGLKLFSSCSNFVNRWLGTLVSMATSDACQQNGHTMDSQTSTRNI